MGSAPLLFELLTRHGPPLLFLLAILETSFVTGLLVPSGIATSAATILALQGGVGFPPVIAAAIGGGFIGDTLGYWIGRAWGEHLLRENGRWGRLLGQRRRELDDLFERHPVYSVTTARTISFVRTMMPMGAGMSGMPYVHFVPFEVVGLILWCGIYIAIGYMSREGWQVATHVFGIGGAVLFVGGTLVALVVVRRRGRSGPPRAAS